MFAKFWLTFRPKESNFLTRHPSCPKPGYKMAAEFPGWMIMSEASERYGVSYMTLRKMVRDEVFTKGQFSTAASQPPVYLRIVELDAWKRGGIAAVAPLKAAFERSEAALASNDLGGEG